MSILKSVKKHVSLSQEEEQYFVSLFEERILHQGDFIEKPDQITTYFIHVKSGCLITYYTDAEAHDHVIQFATINWWTGDLDSFTKQIPSSYSTRALNHSEVLVISKTSFDSLLTRYPIFEKYFRIIFQNSLITHQHRILQNISLSAEERYLSFKKNIQR
jgi:CRP-like cAMP-binding protein